MATYQIPEVNLDTLQARIDKLNRRAGKLGFSLIRFEVGEPVVTRIIEKDWAPDERYESQEIALDEPIPAGWVETRIQRVYPVEVEGEAPKINGWTFVATLEHVSEGSERMVILRSVPGQGDVPACYRQADPGNCDHCKKWRARTETFILRSDAGEWKQVGRNCLRDFLGHTDPHVYAEWLQTLMEVDQAARDAEDPDAWGEGGAPKLEAWSLERFLAVTALVIRHQGWTSRGASHETGATPTAAHVTYYLTCTRDERKRSRYSWLSETPTKDDESLAADVAAWAKGFADRDDLSDYLYNLLVVARLGVVEQRTAGLAASMIVSYTKERERELQRQRQAATSHHVGTVGKRETFKGLLCEGIIYLDGQFPSHLHKFRDGEGNVVVWFSSSLTLKQGQVYDLTATVKDHNTRDGVAQTIITRAKVVATAQAA